MTAVAVPITTALIIRINRREAQIRDAVKTTLELANAQGIDLMNLRDATRHNKQGGFKAALKQTCLSRKQAYRYIKVTELWPTKRVGADTVAETTIEAFIGEQPRSERRALTKADAEFVLKINALATRGATSGERDNAESALDGLAQKYGTDADNLVKKAENVNGIFKPVWLGSPST